MTSAISEKLAILLTSLLTKIDNHCCNLSNTQQPFGVCHITPKSPYVGLPPKEIHSKLQNLAEEFLKTRNLQGIYFRYWIPPAMPVPKDSANPPKIISTDDYQLTLEIPQFDQKWQRTVIARNLIYCPLDPEAYEYQDVFELQEEAIRLVPILHQTVKELEIISNIERALFLPAIPVFETFIYKYGLTDHNQAMSQEERKQWNTKEIKWQERYKFVPPMIKSAKTLHDLYAIARMQAISSRNRMIKTLFWAFIEHIENNLINLTQLPEVVKSRLLDKFRQTKKRVRKQKYIAKKRAVISISDVECGQMLYVMIRDYLINRDNALAEAIFFVWIAQHSAFSSHRLTLDSILNIQVSDIDVNEMTIQITTKETYLTDGLNSILSAWIENIQNNECKKIFQNITIDSLEDIISKYSQELYGKEGRLLPRDFLEKVHVISGVRMTLDLRRKIIAQEKLIIDSPYRIKSEKIKKDILKSVNAKTA